MTKDNEPERYWKTVHLQNVHFADWVNLYIKARPPAATSRRKQATTVITTKQNGTNKQTKHHGLEMLMIFHAYIFDFQVFLVGK